jgi:FkbM family methyltransferase
MDFEAKLEAFYSQLPLQDAVVVDVGAHIGRHAIPLASHVGMKGVCYAFEPVPSVRQLLATNISQLGLNNTVILPFALGESNRIAEFNFIPNLPEESGLKKRHIYNAEPSGFQLITVQVRRLDDVMPPSTNVKFIKMDVEGGELDVLKGSLRILDAARPIVAFECGAAGYLGYDANPDEIFEIFSSRGYSVYSITGVRIADVKEFRHETTTQRFWDYIALPENDSDLAQLLTSGQAKRIRDNAVANS